MMFKKMVEEMGTYIEEMQNGSCTTTARIFARLFPEEVDKSGKASQVPFRKMIRIDAQVREWIKERNKVYLDNLDHYNNLEGLPYNLDFIVRHRNSEGKFLTKIPYYFFLSVLAEKNLVEEISFCFYNDKRKYSIGYSNETKKYWAKTKGDKNITEYRKAEELLEANIYPNGSLKKVWKEVEWILFSGLELDDWIEALQLE